MLACFGSSSWHDSCVGGMMTECWKDGGFKAFMGMDFSDTRSRRSGLDLGVVDRFDGSWSRERVFNGFGRCDGRRWGLSGFRGCDGIINDRCWMEKGLVTNDHG